jgi:hypothetical protein
VNRTAAILIGVVLFLAFLGILTWQMMSGRTHRVEVCMAFQGREQCKVAAGSTREEAVRTATTAACALIAGGVTDTQACERSQPVAVRPVE